MHSAARLDQVARVPLWGAQEANLIDELVAYGPAGLEPGFRQIWSDLLLLRIAIESSPVCVAVTDMTRPDRPLAFVNPAFERTTGYSHREVVGRNCRFLQGPGTSASAVRTMRDAIDAGLPADVTLLNYRRDGMPFMNRVLLQPVRNMAGTLVAYVGHQLTEEFWAQVD